ncbi:MAG: CDP-alcohol phosphatidyltransferase family protein [Alphaproteobacteria bacterium]|nr:CDP-alcohol phosphatidyltransferase family protein [Rhodospirillales bacterium]MCW9045674.1 CDP-alcohol phosphatidyltransferase family protein [Alphaproteobacteria bacterium]
MDYFSEEERQKQEAFASYRDAKLKPLTDFLTKLNIRANHVTTAAVILLFLGCMAGPEWGWTASFLLFFYCFLDGIDGPLARSTNSQHQGGAIIDMVADQAGVIVAPAAAIYHLGTDGIAAVLFASLYVSFIALVVYANNNGIKLFKIVRLKYFFYFVYCLSILINYDLVTYLFYVADVYYLIVLLLVVARIYKFFAAQEGSKT